VGTFTVLALKPGPPEADSAYMGYRSLAVLMALGALATAPSALAGTTDSTNWAGYAIQRRGVGFRTVTASWTQPRPTCRRGSDTYSSYWVGLGGFSDTSQALEQVGTEADCTRAGKTSQSAWWETVPAPAFDIFLSVRAGDVMAARVTVQGHTVRMVLRNLSQRWTFTKTVHTSPIDISSAEWIVEAPSECQGNACQTLPLANFGAATFTSASATTVRGHTGSPANANWQLTRIRLRPAGRQFAVSGTLAGGATPSALQTGGSGFSVVYSLVPLAAPGYARDSRLRAGRLAHRVPALAR
jgi:hypothetical protein